MQGLNNPIGIKSIEPNQNPFITNPYRFAAAGVGGWVELGRTTLGSATSTIDVSSLSDKRYYMILNNYAANIDNHIRFNNDSGTNYAQRRSDDGSESSNASQNKISINANAGGTNARFSVGYVANLATKEKLFQSWTIRQQTAGSGTAPSRTEAIGKHAQTSNPIDQMTIVNTGGNFPIGAELVVLGWDPADTHTSNFWEELDSVDLSGGAATTLTTNTFTPKKYLWIQGFADKSVAVTPRFRVGNAGTIDTGTNYARRRSENGGADATSINADGIYVEGGVPNGSTFFNFFIVNNASNEKLMIWNYCSINTVGAGGAPDRGEGVAKWTDTTNQITDFQIYNAGGTNFGTNSILKVYGSD